MYFDKYFPFYEAYASPLLYQGERMQEEEFELIQEQVEEECDLLDYEGSRLYDEYPDKYMFYHLCRRIRQRAEPELKVQSMDGSFLDELVQVLLLQEISRRRCRRHRCRRYF